MSNGKKCHTFMFYFLFFVQLCPQFWYRKQYIISKDLFFCEFCSVPFFFYWRCFYAPFGITAHNFHFKFKYIKTVWHSKLWRSLFILPFSILFSINFLHFSARLCFSLQLFCSPLIYEKVSSFSPIVVLISVEDGKQECFL